MLSKHFTVMHSKPGKNPGGLANTVKRVKLPRSNMKNQNFAELLKGSLGENRFRLLQLVVEEATQRDLPLYVVGGAVRDLVLGRPLNDFDLIVEGDAIALARSLAAQHDGRVTAHTKFG